MTQREFAIAWKNDGMINNFKPNYCGTCRFNFPFFIAEILEHWVNKRCPACFDVMGGMAKKHWEPPGTDYHRLKTMKAVT
jgi:hypothetical protein